MKKIILIIAATLLGGTALFAETPTLKKWGQFSLKEGFVVSGIDIYGGYPYLSVRLRRIITVHTGELYDSARAVDQRQKLAAFYERQGFAGTSVELTPRFNLKKKTADLVYRIRKGRRFRIGKVTVTGATVFPYSYFVTQLNPLIAYDPIRFRKRLEKIRADYKKKGYLHARVQLKDLGRDEDTRRVNPVLDIIEGRHVSVHFEGNNRVSNRTFKSILPMFVEGGYSRYDIDASVRSMKNYYQRLGFQEVEIQMQMKDLGGLGLLVSFRIHEGPQAQVKEIQIKGNREIKAGTIKEDLMTREASLFERGPYQPKTVERDLQELPQILKSRGALDSVVLGHETKLNPWHDKALVTFRIREGEITRIKEIRFEGNSQIPTASLVRRIKMHSGDPLTSRAVERDIQEISLFYNNSGFPYARVSSDVSRSGTEATLLYRIDEGTKVKIGEILIIGNERTDRKSILRGILLKKDDLFSYRKVLDSETTLRRTGSFRSANIETIGLTEKEAVVHLLVRLEEYRKFLTDLGFTFDTDHQFTGTMTLNDLNLFGTMRRSAFKLIGGRDIQQGELIFKDPAFLGFRLDGAVSGKIGREKRPGFEIIEGGGAVSVLKDFTQRVSLLGRYEITRTFFTALPDPGSPPVQDHTTSKFSLSFNYDKRDSFADPRKGFVGFAGLDVSTKLFASTSNFIQPKAYFAHYLALGNPLTLLNFARIEDIKVFGSDNLTRDQKLFLGGDYSIRGFDEDAVGPTVVGTGGQLLPAGGLLLLQYTAELQARLLKDLKFAIFSDNGSLSSGFSDLGQASFRHSAGFGLRYTTPVGPIRLDYGIKVDRDPGESFGRLHFAFGYVF